MMKMRNLSFFGCPPKRSFFIIFNCLTFVEVLFCGLMKGISLKICILCVRVILNKHSCEPFWVWILIYDNLLADFTTLLPQAFISWISDRFCCWKLFTEIEKNHPPPPTPTFSSVFVVVVICFVFCFVVVICFVFCFVVVVICFVFCFVVVVICFVFCFVVFFFVLLFVSFCCCVVGVFSGHISIMRHSFRMELCSRHYSVILVLLFQYCTGFSCVPVLSLWLMFVF